MRIEKFYGLRKKYNFKNQQIPSPWPDYNMKNLSGKITQDYLTGNTYSE